MSDAERIRLLEATVRRLTTLARLVTVRQVIEAGNAAIDAAGLNPWCLNEGLADGHETLSLWWAEAALESTASASEPHKTSDVS